MGQEINIIQGDQKNLTNYTFHWLKYMAEWSGMTREDVELVSICDIDELNVLRKPKTRAIRIVGGSEAFNDRFISQYADAVVVGEGFEFFKAYKAGGLAYALSLPCVLTPDKAQVVPSTHVDWNLAPVIKIRKRKLMALGGRGCANKCKFCFTSWTTKHQNAPEISVPEAYQKYHLNVITNDSGGPAIHQRVPNRSIPIKQYLQMSVEEAQLCRYYRFGLESFSEAGRRFFNKPISNEEVRQALYISQRLNHDIQLFIIAGIEPQESALEFLDAMGPLVSKKPRIIVKVTYFNPCIHTPLEAFDISQLKNWDHKWLFRKLTEYSGRYRLTMAHDPGHFMWRGLVKRARTLDDAEALWPMRLMKRAELEPAVHAAGLSYLFTEVPESKINFEWRKTRRFTWQGGIE